MDIEDVTGGPAPSKSTVTVTKKRAREEPAAHDVMSPWRDQLGPVPSMGSSRVKYKICSLTCLCKGDNLQ